MKVIASILTGLLLLTTVVAQDDRHGPESTQTQEQNANDMSRHLRRRNDRPGVGEGGLGRRERAGVGVSTDT